MQKISTAIIICLSLFSAFVRADDETDNSRLLLSKIEGEEKVEVYRSLAKTCLDSLPDSVDFYCRTAVDLAEKLNHPELLADTYYDVAKIYFDLSDTEKTRFFLEIGLKLADSLRYEEMSADIRQFLGRIYTETGEPEKAL